MECEWHVLNPILAGCDSAHVFNLEIEGQLWWKIPLYLWDFGCGFSPCEQKYLWIYFDKKSEGKRRIKQNWMWWTSVCDGVLNVDASARSYVNCFRWGILTKRALLQLQWSEGLQMILNFRLNIKLIKVCIRSKIRNKNGIGKKDHLGIRNNIR